MHTCQHRQEQSPHLVKKIKVYFRDKWAEPCSFFAVGDLVRIQGVVVEPNPAHTGPQPSSGWMIRHKVSTPCPAPCLADGPVEWKPGVGCVSVWQRGFIWVHSVFLVARSERVCLTITRHLDPIKWVPSGTPLRTACAHREHRVHRVPRIYPVVSLECPSPPRTRLST